MFREFFCKKYKKSNPDEDCGCNLCMSESKSLAELRDIREEGLGRHFKNRVLSSVLFKR